MKYIIPFSAKSTAALKRNAFNLFHFLSDDENLSDKTSIENIAYTLQVGRDAMKFRMAFIVETVPELIKKLNIILNDNGKLEFLDDIFIGEIQENKNREKMKEVHKDIIKDWHSQGNLVKIVEHWISGNKLNWMFLYSGVMPNKISLPSYSFERERYWPNCTESFSIQNHSSGGYKELSSESRSIDELNLRKKTENDLIKIAHQILKVPLEKLDVNTNLSDFGLDSVSLVKCARGISNHFNFQITPAQLFSNLTIGALTSYMHEEYHKELCKFYSAIELLDELGVVEENISITSVGIDFNPNANKGNESVAIIGMSGKFPKSNDLEEYWDNLLLGKDCISGVPYERKGWMAYIDEAPEEKNIMWGGFIEGLQKFDPGFFGLSDNEAEIMDPQQRLLLTYAYKAIEDAGYNCKTLSNINAGVFVAIGNNGYDAIVANSGRELDAKFLTGYMPSVGANRVSFFFDLHGPSEPVETACASSLVAIHRAINEINNGVCDIAIVGGVNLIVTPYGHASLNKAGLLSNEGKCKPFSSNADGFVRAEGIGVIVLKRLSIAEKDNDQIYAVIRGSGVNHNGRGNFLTAPNPKAQAALLESVYKRAGIDINTVNYIETHGTGTELGDAVEIEGLKSAFRTLGYEKASGQSTKNCAIGSVKSNIGHTELASGMASLIKVVYQMKNEMLVKTIHCDSINPDLNLDESPFFVVRENQRWNMIKDKFGASLPRRAGISSFGLSGVNAHIILEEYLNDRADVKRAPLAKHQFSESDYWINKKFDQLVSGALDVNKLNTNEDKNLFSKWYGKF
ncbi:beta-ketoacyl synthase N-terminal-like domain-containing protein [Chromobacterium piscinae]|uniref:beta-ketoacyl synthase N-terminal-like domain-containing protein n=1 Tax=Chromobacterium piscinae TaxID=686831 RepID=UPI001E64E923|nr:beta-ketoacyl synthase N-terminal-like domain-containing protein [Chromobacterium piscinae]MCD5329205.1 phosphopantetheine-binding protein [Chromobacterium piscinae]